MPRWSFHQARGLLSQKLRMVPTMADITTLLLDTAAGGTATSACRTSECPQTFWCKKIDL